MCVLIGFGCALLLWLWLWPLTFSLVSQWCSVLPAVASKQHSCLTCWPRLLCAARLLFGKSLSGEYMCEESSRQRHSVDALALRVCHKGHPGLNLLRHWNCSALLLQLCHHISQHACATLRHCIAAVHAGWHLWGPGQICTAGVVVWLSCAACLSSEMAVLETGSGLVGRLTGRLPVSC